MQLAINDNALVCNACNARHPVVDGIPVILHPGESVFDRDTIIREYRERPAERKRRKLFRLFRKFVPSIGTNLAASDVAARMRAMLQEIDKPRILIVGGGDAGVGIEAVLDEPRFELIESDVYFGPRCNLIADAHNLPFQANSFDAVICQAVLEHVVRPQDCINQIHRVLKPGGVFFADVPFMYPVHMREYDFTRFSLGGLRLACRGFEECCAGISGGPFQAVAIIIFHSCRTLSSARIWQVFVTFGLPWFIFWLHHVDKLLKSRLQCSDSASGVYFLGTKSETRRSERAVIQQYWRVVERSERS